MRFYGNHRFWTQLAVGEPISRNYVKFERGLLEDYRFWAHPVVCYPLRRNYVKFECGLLWESPIFEPTSGWRANSSEFCEV